MNKKTAKKGFTLVELLLVIAIVAILASLGVGVMGQAQEDAAIAATRSRMNMIQKILEIELEDYEVKRSPVSFATLAAMVRSSSFTQATTNERLLLHVKNLKRMFIADLVRAEMPDGSRSGSSIVGVFPSETLTSRLGTFGITNFSNVTEPASISNWSDWATNKSWSMASDSALGDGIDEEAADKAELLYQVLLNIDVDGVPATEQLGGQSIGDTDNDGILEIVDAWGEPLYLQWQQEWMEPVGNAADNIWNTTGQFAGLSREHLDPGTPNPAVLPPTANYCQPVLPTQIRPFLMSERMLKIDALPADYDLNHTF